MDKKKLEIRSYGGDAAPKIEGRTIEGYAVIFNQPSEIMYDAENRRFFRETIQPGAVSDELLSRSDIKAVVEHNRERLLARYNKGVGTLKLSLDERGLKYSFEAPNTQDGDFVVEMIRRGDISGSSFMFGVVKGKGDTWEKRSGGIWSRSISEVKVIADITVTTDPAYTQTDVSVRSIQDMEQPEAEERSDDFYKIQLEILKRRI